MTVNLLAIDIALDLVLAIDQSVLGCKLVLNLWLCALHSVGLKGCSICSQSCQIHVVIDILI